MVDASRIVDSPEQAYNLFSILVSNDYDIEAPSVELGDWTCVRVYIPDHAIYSSITPPYMEAFLELQRQIYQYVAFIETGSAEVRQLSEEKKLYYQLNIRVTGGSADYVAVIKDILEKIFGSLARKMTGKQALTVTLGLALILCSGWAFKAWLENQKEIRIEEIKSQERVEALRLLSYANMEQSKRFSEIIAALEKQGELGIKAVEAASTANEALIKAASKTGSSKINDQLITGEEAKILRSQMRRRVEIKYKIEEFRVVDINTTYEDDIVTFLDESLNRQHKVSIKNNLFSDEDRKRIFEALEHRGNLWVELAVKERDRETLSVEFLKLAQDPTKRLRQTQVVPHLGSEGIPGDEEKMSVSEAERAPRP